MIDVIISEAVKESMVGRCSIGAITVVECLPANIDVQISDHSKVYQTISTILC